mmetsp:Transcript_35007/g.138718  ORF Transcript_35007/g.138718 Transcript_35007/m.138718 type:complete len:110 (+) Transcript_35007:286-615(+)
MACAGDPPPFTDKGGAFIHDPKIASTTETKAKIRLQFTDVSNKKIIVNRQFQVTNKANRRQEFKTVEQSLQYTNEHGEKQTISHRYASTIRSEQRTSDAHVQWRSNQVQ